MGLVLPLAAICTSYMGIALSEVDNIKEFLRINKLYAWALTVVPSLLIHFAGLKSFVNALWLALLVGWSMQGYYQQ